MFNQLLFDLEAEVFGYFKDWAASTTLDKMFKRIIEARRGWGHYFPGRRRYEVKCCSCARVVQTVVEWFVSVLFPPVVFYCIQCRNAATCVFIPCHWGSCLSTTILAVTSFNQQRKNVCRQHRC